MICVQVTLRLRRLWNGAVWKKDRVPEKKFYVGTRRYLRVGELVCGSQPLGSSWGRGINVQQWRWWNPQEVGQGIPST